MINYFCRQLTWRRMRQTNPSTDLQRTTTTKWMTQWPNCRKYSASKSPIVPWMTAYPRGRNGKMEWDPGFRRSTWWSCTKTWLTRMGSAGYRIHFRPTSLEECLTVVCFQLWSTFIIIGSICLLIYDLEVTLCLIFVFLFCPCSEF